MNAQPKAKFTVLRSATVRKGEQTKQGKFAESATAPLQSYGNTYEYTSAVVEVANSSELFEVRKVIAYDPYVSIIHALPKPTLQAEIAHRCLIHDKEGYLATYEDRGNNHFTVIDLDTGEYPEGLNVLETPEECIKHVDSLVPTLADVSKVVEFSSSAHLKPTKVKAHILFLTDRNHTTQELIAWSKTQEVEIDPASFRPRQILYGQPILPEGSDPIKNRIFYIKGANDRASLEIPVIEKPYDSPETFSSFKVGSVLTPSNLPEPTEEQEKKAREILDRECEKLWAVETNKHDAFMKVAFLLGGYLYALKMDEDTLSNYIVSGLADRVDIPKYLKDGLSAIKAGMKKPIAIYTYDDAELRFPTRLQHALAMKERYGVKVVEVHERYFNADTIKGLGKGIYLLSGMMGTGKTEVFKELVKGVDTALYLTHLMSLAENASSRLGLESYQDLKGGYRIAEAEKLALCINSLSKLYNADGEIDHISELLLIDEIVSILSRLLNSSKSEEGSIKGLREIWETMTYLINTSPTVVLADARASESTIRYLKAILTPENFSKVTIVVNTWEPEVSVPMTVVDNDNVAAIVNMILTSLYEGKRVYVAVNSKNYSKLLERVIKYYVKDAKVLVVNSDNRGDLAQKALLATPNQEAKKYDCVIASPVVTSGFSFNAVNGVAAFDEVYGIGFNFGERGGGSDEFLQSLGRVREAKSVTVWVEHKKRRVNTLDQIRISLVGSKYDSEYAGLFVGFHDGKRFINEVPYVALKIQSERERMEDQSHLRLSVFSKAESQDGYRLQHCTLDTNHAFYQGLLVFLESGKEDVKDQEVQDICEAKTITEEQYQEIRTSFVPTSEQLNQVKSYELEAFFGDYKPKAELAKLDRNKELRRKIRRLERAVGTREEAYARFTKQEGKFEVDKKMYVTEYDFLRLIMSAVGLNQQLPVSTTPYNKNSESIAEFCKIVDERRESYSRFLEIPPTDKLLSNPMRFIGQCVKFLGLKQTGYGRNGNYVIDGLVTEEMKGYIEYRRQMVESKADTLSSDELGSAQDRDSSIQTLLSEQDSELF